LLTEKFFEIRGGVEVDIGRKATVRGATREREMLFENFAVGGEVFVVGDNFESAMKG